MGKTSGCVAEEGRSILVKFYQMGVGKMAGVLAISAVAAGPTTGCGGWVGESWRRRRQERHGTRCLTSAQDRGVQPGAAERDAGVGRRVG